jgi:aminopeptidase N
MGGGQEGGEDTRGVYLSPVVLRAFGPRWGLLAPNSSALAVFMRAHYVVAVRSTRGVNWICTITERIVPDCSGSVRESLSPICRKVGFDRRCGMRKHLLRVLISVLLAVLSVGSVGAEPFDQLDKPDRFTRDRTFDLVHTRIDIEVDIEAGRVHGATTLTFDAIVSGRDTVVLDAVNMTINKVTTPDGRVLSHDYDGSSLVIRFSEKIKRRQRVGVVVHYAATPKNGMHFVKKSKARPNIVAQAWTQGEDEYTRYWTPCYDFPDDMGTTETLVTVKEGLKVLSNGKLLGSRAVDGKVQWHWAQSKPHTTYLIMLAIGPWKVKNKMWRGKEISFWYENVEAEWVDRTFNPTIDMLDWFTDQVGLVYPWEKYAQVVATDYFWGGMENTSATILTVDTLHDAKAEPDYSSQNLVAHELAHQWFGDLLTCRGWGELWLNEGFATYFSALYREHRQGWDDFIGNMVRSRGWLEGEMKRYKRPIVTHAYNEPGDMFDGHSYTKGAWVLHALRGWINDDAVWWRAIQKWVGKHKHRFVETDQLRRSVEKSTGLNLGRFFHQWLYKAGLPELKVTSAWDRASGTLKVTIAQTQKTDRWVSLFRLPIDLRVVGPENKVFERRFWIDQKTTDFVIPLAARPRFVEVDPKAWTPGKVDIHWSRKEAMDALKHGSTVVTRYRAARRLATWVGDEAIARILSEQVKKEGDWVGQRIAKTLGVINTPEAFNGLLALRDHKESRVRAEAASALVTYAPDARITAWAKDLLEDDSYRVVAAVAGNYWRYKTPKGFSSLKRLVGDYSPYHVVSSAALGSMARMNGKAALKVLRKHISPSTDRRLRSGAYRAMGRIGGKHSDLQKKALELAEKGLADPNPGVRRAAIDAFEVAGRADKAGLLLRMASYESHRRTQNHAKKVAKGLQSRAADPVGDLRDRLKSVEDDKKGLERRIDLLEKRLSSQRNQPHPPR